MGVCMYCMGVYMPEWVHACMCVCMYGCMHVWVYACMCVCMYACMQVWWMYVCLYVCTYAHTCVCKYLCMHVWIHITCWAWAASLSLAFLVVAASLSFLQRSWRVETRWPIALEESWPLDFNFVPSLHTASRCGCRPDQCYIVILILWSISYVCMYVCI